MDTEGHKLDCDLFSDYHPPSEHKITHKIATKKMKLCQLSSSSSSQDIHPPTPKDMSSSKAFSATPDVIQAEIASALTIIIKNKKAWKHWGQHLHVESKPNRGGFSEKQPSGPGLLRLQAFSHSGREEFMFRAETPLCQLSFCIFKYTLNQGLLCRNRSVDLELGNLSQYTELKLSSGDIPTLATFSL